MPDRYPNLLRRPHFPDELALWRRAWLSLLPAFLLWIAAFLLGRSDSRIAFAAFAVAALAVLCADRWLLNPYQRMRRARAQVIRDSGYLFCPDCLYDLRATPTAPVCPECGADYTAHERELIWRDRNRFLEPRYYGEFDPRYQRTPPKPAASVNERANTPDATPPPPA